MQPQQHRIQITERNSSLEHFNNRKKEFRCFLFSYKLLLNSYKFQSSISLNSTISNRDSYFFSFRGSSFVFIHQGMLLLRRRCRCCRGGGGNEK